MVSSWFCVEDASTGKRSEQKGVDSSVESTKEKTLKDEAKDVREKVESVWDRMSERVDVESHLNKLTKFTCSNTTFNWTAYLAQTGMSEADLAPLHCFHYLDSLKNGHLPEGAVIELPSSEVSCHFNPLCL